MNNSKTTKLMHHAKTPRAAAIAGALFGILFTACIILIQLSLPPLFTDMAAWSEVGQQRVALALQLLPIAGLAFLWFVGVVRDRLGAFEDQFFGEVFQGSALLFLAMVFCAFAVAAGMVFAYQFGGELILTDSLYQVGRSVINQLFAIYAFKMAAVCMFSISTLWLNTSVMPRWLCFLTYAMAILMFFSPNNNLWMLLVFPAWVFCVSVYILVLTVRQKSSDTADGMTPKPIGPG